MKKTEELQEALRRVKVVSENCYDVVVDLRMITFHSDEEEMYLQDLATDTRYMFKASTANPKDPLRTNAQRQFCKMVNVPFNFFIENRPTTRNTIVNQWLTSFAPKEGDETLALIKIREGGLTKVIRAIVPLSFADMPTSDVLSALTMFPGDVEVDIDEDVTKGIDRDSLLIHLRVLYHMDLGGEYSAGVAITTSEVGTSDLVIDSFLFHRETKTYLMAQYGGQPFARIQHTKMQSPEILEILNSIPQRIQEEAERYLGSLNEVEDQFPGVERACIGLSSKKGVPKKFKRGILLEAQNALEDMGNLKDFVTHAGLVAKDFDIAPRTKIERAIGSFAGLNFEKK